MRAASSRIWSTITNNHQPSNHPAHSIDDPPADKSQPFNDRYKATSGGSNSVHESGSHSRYRSPREPQLKTTLVDGYTQLITDRIRDGWSCHLVTILFSQLPGPRGAILNRMKDEVQRVYSTLLTRVHRKPRTASTGDLPVLLGAADLPVYKRDRTSTPAVLCNGGLHFHALVLIPPKSRLRESLADHFQNKWELYAGSGKSIQRIDVRPVVEGHERVVDYVLKTVLNGRLSYDEAVLVLPRARGELEAV
jgi:hypothetical protein